MKTIPDRYGGGIIARAIYPTAKLNWFISLLVVSKFVRVASIYLTYDILKFVHLVQFLFVVKTIAASVLAVVQKPFSSGKPISKEQWPLIIRHGLFSSVLSLVWLFGLTLCGPLRSVFIFEHHEVVIIAFVSALFSGSGGPAKKRGAVFFLVAVVTLLLFDNDSGSVEPTEHPEGKQHHGLNHLFYYLISWSGVADHKGGVFLLVITTCLQAGLSSASRKLALDVGGPKRLHALSTLVSAPILAPWALFLRVTQESTNESWLSLFIPFALIALALFVTDYYAEAVSVQRLEESRTAKWTSFSILAAALVIATLWNHPYTVAFSNVNLFVPEHYISGGVIFSCIMLFFATMILSSQSRTASKGTFVGYSSSGLPLYTFSGDALHRTSQSVLMFLGTTMKQILDEPDSRKIFYFLCVNLIFTFVELCYGIWTNSLGLISDGFHMLFDCSALVMGLYAAMMSRWKASRTFPFGYGRIEVLSGFINGLFLVVISFFVFTEALNRLVDPPEIRTERLLTVSVAGLLVNLVGIAAFHHGHSHGGGSIHSHAHSSHSHHHHSRTPAAAHGHGHSHLHSNANMQGVFLHILADTLGSVGVIVSSLLIQNFGWLIADPVCSLFIAVLIFFSVLPLLRDSSLILLLRTPLGMEKDISTALQKVLSIEGVLSYRDYHFWNHSANMLAGTIHVQVQSQVNEQKIISQVSAVFRDLDFAHFTVQVEKEEYFLHLTGLSSSAGVMLNSMKTVSSLNFDTSVMVKAV